MGFLEDRGLAVNQEQTLRNEWAKTIRAMGKWSLWCTLTFAIHGSQHRCRTEFLGFIQRMERRYGTPVLWFRLDEQGFYRMWHSHALLTSEAPISRTGVDFEWKAGRVEVAPYDSSRGAAFYLTKFVEDPIAEYDFDHRLINRQQREMTASDHSYR